MLAGIIPSGHLGRYGGQPPLAAFAHGHVHRVAPTVGLDQGVQILGREIPAFIWAVGTKYCMRRASRALGHVLVTEPEEQLVPVAVEVEAGDDYRTADVPPGYSVESTFYCPGSSGTNLRCLKMELRAKR